ncbi:MAG: hypothetical protein QOG13_674 [Sphingomonadales bacterium]|jgi:glycosyltransferase involved in cell wall biosynthesis|nr:hypothetical protein [Sphingomonadales bacterium]
MRVFQTYGLQATYKPRLRGLRAGAASFREMRAILLGDRFGAVHLLQPCLSGDPEAFLTAGNDEEMQRAWAAENGLPATAGPDEILLAQIEAHRTEIFYNCDPMNFGNAFLKRLPGSVRRTIAWRAAPSEGGDFLDHDLIVNNFPSLLARFRAQGARAELFTPGHDPEMDAYAARAERPIDLLFVGGFSRHHRRRAEALRRAAGLRDRYRLVFCLDPSRLTRLAETPLGLAGPLRRHRRPAEIRAVAAPPVYGRDLYAMIGQAKLVLNGAVDMAGAARGNMRMWEAMGCGAAMVSDAGDYPDGMVAGDTFLDYSDGQQMIGAIETLLERGDQRKAMASRAHAMISSRYSKSAQWGAFQRLCE